MRLRRTTAAALVGVLTALSAVVHAQAPGSITIRLIEASAARADDPRARLYINDHVAPGARITRRLEVINTTGQPQELDFYAVAADLAEAAFAIGDGRATNELTSWTTVEPASSRVPDGGAVELTVRIQVPEDASSGERYGAVVAERPPAPGETGISTSSRVGIRIYLSVGPGGEPASDFAIDTLTASRNPAGAPVVEARVVNSGGRALDLTGDLRLTDGPGGLSAGPFDVRLGTTLGVGQRAPVTVELDQAVPAGPWRAELRLRSGRTARAATGTLTFPDEAATQAAPVRAQELRLSEDPNVVIPIAIGVLVLVVVLLLLVLLRNRARRATAPAG